MQLPTLDQLITDFTVLPKVIKQPTYLELCKYPRRRYEEICSRLLCFYMNPEREYGLGYLFLQSLFGPLSPDEPPNYQAEKINVISEENAEGKRLDILVYGPSFVLGIENKVSADADLIVASGYGFMDRHINDNFINAFRLDSNKRLLVNVYDTEMDADVKWKNCIADRLQISLDHITIVNKKGVDFLAETRMSIFFSSLFPDESDQAEVLPS